MSIVSGVFGSIATGIVGVILYYQWRILQQFRTQEDISMKQFLADDQAPAAFMVVVVTAFIYAMTLFVSAAALNYNVTPLTRISQGGTIITLVGFLMFFRRIALLTRPEPV